MRNTAFAALAGAILLSVSAPPARAQGDLSLYPPFGQGQWAAFRPDGYAQYPATRHAFEFFLVDRNGRRARYSGPTANEHFYCFGQPVLAPAAGTVAIAIGTVPDNPVPGQVAPGAPPLGNYVLLRLSTNHHVLLAHLRHGTVSVRPGQVVQAGMPVGHCGNSGNISEPRIGLRVLAGGNAYDLAQASYRFVFLNARLRGGFGCGPALAHSPAPNDTFCGQ